MDERAERVEQEANSGRYSVRFSFTQRAFLSRIRWGDTDREALDAVDATRADLEEWRKDSAFLSAFEDCRKDAADLIEAHTLSIAMDGVEEPIISRRTGEQVGTRRVMYPQLLQFLLKGRKPEVYGDKIETTNTHRITDERRATLRDQIVSFTQPGSTPPTGDEAQ